MKALMVCKDMGPTNMIGPMAQELNNQGHTIWPVLEGLSVTQWPKVCGVPSISIAGDASAVLEEYRSDVVVVGTSSPSNLEKEFARAAQGSGIPVVVVEDFWGGAFTRLGLLKAPDIVLTLDEYSARLVRQQFGPQSRVVVVGNPGVLPNVQPAYEVMRLRSSGDMVITLVGGGFETAEQIQLLIQCLELTSKGWRLIPRWHPKYIDLPDSENGNRPYRETWDALLEQLGGRVVRVNSLLTAEVVVASNIVVSGYSTLLSTAAYYPWRVAVSLQTSRVLQALAKESPLEQIPQVELGISNLVATPVDLALIKPCSAEARARLIPLNPVVGAEAICALVGGK